MCTGSGTRLLAFVVLAAVSADAAALRGTVMHKSTAVAGADVALAWTWQGSTASARGTIFRTNARGAFNADIEKPRWPVTLLAYDQERKLGGFVVVRESDAARPVRIDLAPLIEVRGVLVGTPDPGNVAGTNVTFRVAAEKCYDVVDCDPNGATFVLRVPPGEYELRCSPRVGPQYVQVISVQAGKARLDLGRIALEALPGRTIGQAPPPWNVTDARGVPVSVKLSDYRGKWVLLEFWGYW